MTGKELVLQIMERGRKLLAVADDDPQYVVLIDDPRYSAELSISEVDRALFDELVASGKLRPVDVGQGGKWYEVAA